MDEPILKIHWERFRAHVDLDRAAAQSLLYPYIRDPIDQLLLLSEGCANTNYKVTFKSRAAPVVIRIYLREKDALSHEVNIHKMVANKVPVPKHLYVDSSCAVYPHPYSIMECIDGLLMRELIIKLKDEKAISECTYEAGEFLSELRKIQFSQGGFFQKNLEIRPFNQEEKYLPFGLMLLQDDVVKASLGSELRHSVETLMRENSALYPSENGANLTHGDYDPANILVRKMQNKWKIAAILDWEFAFAGTYLLDIGMMLRYSHKIPACYEKNFIEGIENHSGRLPPEWKKQAKLMDLLCLLNLARFNPPKERPKMNSDVVSLITDTVKNWELF